jgi:hypothetical protein
MEESRHTGDTEEEHGCEGDAEAYDGCPDMSERRVGGLDFRKVAGSQHWGEDRYAQCSGAVAWALGLVLESWGQYFVKTTAMGSTTVCQWRSRRCARILQGDISVYCSRLEELEVTVHRLECEKDVLQGNLMAGERKGEMLQGVKKSVTVRKRSFKTNSRLPRTRRRLAHHNDVWYGRIPACW